MAAISAVTVFGGAAAGFDPAHRAAALALGAALAAAGITVIYGGGGIGIMGAVAEGALGAGGRVIGIIPDFLARREAAHRGVSEMIVTDSMHDRKRRMFEMSDAFITMPGGLGTLDETFEMITWKQLSLHDKPIIIGDIAGWGRAFVTLVDSLVAQGFAPEASHGLYEVMGSPEEIVARLREMPAIEGGTDSARL